MDISTTAASILIESAPLLRVCRRCGTDGREAAQQNEPLCPRNDGGNVGVTSHSYIDATPRQSGQVRMLRAAGWQLQTFGARDQLLLVDGVDNHGERFRGQMDADGNLIGEPVDDTSEMLWVHGPYPVVPDADEIRKRAAILLARLDGVLLDGDLDDIHAAQTAIRQLHAAISSTPAGRIVLEEARA